MRGLSEVLKIRLCDVVEIRDNGERPWVRMRSGMEIGLPVPKTDSTLTKIEVLETPAKDFLAYLMVEYI